MHSDESRLTRYNVQQQKFAKAGNEQRIPCLQILERDGQDEHNKIKT